MDIRKVARAALIVAMSWVGAAAPPLGAQTLSPEVPGPSPAPTPPLSELTLRGSLSGGYDVNDISGTSGTASAINIQNPLFRGANTNVGGDFQLQYSSAPGRRFGIGAGWGSSFRLYQGADSMSVSHSAEVGLSAGLSPHLRIDVTAGASYAPRYQFDLLPVIGGSSLGQVSSTPLDYAVSLHEVLTYGTGAAVSYQATKRTSVMLNYDFRDLNSDITYFSGRMQNAAASYHLSFAKGLGVRLGYRYQITHYTDPATGISRPVRGDNIDIGLDYGLSRGLSLSRRTKLTFGVGTGAFSDGRVSRFRLVGNANLTQQLSRRWDLRVAYGRGMNFAEGFGAPVFSDSVTIRTTARLTKRFTAQGSLGYAFGGIEDFTAASRYHSYRSQIGIVSAVTRQLSAFVQYINYLHSFDENAFLVQGVPARLKRQGVRVGLSFDTPLLPGRRPLQRPIP